MCLIDIRQLTFMWAFVYMSHYTNIGEYFKCIFNWIVYLRNADVLRRRVNESFWVIHGSPTNYMWQYYITALGLLLTKMHDDVIKWKYFPCYWPFVRGIHRSQVNSPHKGQWRGALIFSWSMSIQWWGWWFETPSRLLWPHCNVLRHYRGYFNRIFLIKSFSFESKSFCCLSQWFKLQPVSVGLCDSLVPIKRQSVTTSVIDDHIRWHIYTTTLQIHVYL